MAWDHRAHTASALVLCSRRAPQTGALRAAGRWHHQEHAGALVDVSAVLVRGDASIRNRCDETAAPARVVRPRTVADFVEITQIRLGSSVGVLTKYGCWQCPGSAPTVPRITQPGRCRGAAGALPGRCPDAAATLPGRSGALRHLTAGARTLEHLPRAQAACFPSARRLR